MDQRRIMLAVLLSLGVVLLYNELVVRPRQHPSTPPPEASSSPTVATTLPPEAPREIPQAAPGQVGYLSYEVGEARPIVVETDLWRATVTPRGGRLSSVQLKDFRKTVDRDSPPLELVEHASLLPLTIALGPGSSDAGVLYRPDRTSLALTGDATGDIVLTGTTESGLQVESKGSAA